ncbi:MAG: hypothetical protein PWQ55_823 [Chloroflexota bacterium]|nr:hypothetical protein [Chloroflexota bacterium]
MMKTEQINQAHPRRMLEIMDGVMARDNALQHSLLENQAQTLAALQALNGLAAGRPASPPTPTPEVFSRRQLEEFASGSVAKCFGPEYAELDQRKTPRIPNGRLLLIDRVTAISGTRGKPQPPAAITSQVQVPADAWYLTQSAYPQVPLAVLMEMALQPCGILSAYLGTALVIPPENNLFRNLDGSLHCTQIPDLRGRTITNTAELTKAVASSGLYLQTYRFSLSVDGRTFLSGESSFGYFTPATMEKQSGLDGAEKQARLDDADGFPQGWQLLPTAAPGQAGLLDLSDELQADPRGGRYGQGVIVGRKALRPDEWFFANHFYQDPVMPGSLGVEAMARGAWEYLRHEFSTIDLERHVLSFESDLPLRWKYRGQVLPANQTTYFEVHIKALDRSGPLPALRADADFWVDGLRIYAIEDLNLTVKERKQL